MHVQQSFFSPRGEPPVKRKWKLERHLHYDYSSAIGVWKVDGAPAVPFYGADGEGNEKYPLVRLADGSIMTAKEAIGTTYIPSADEIQRQCREYRRLAPRNPVGLDPEMFLVHCRQMDEEELLSMEDYAGE